MLSQKKGVASVLLWESPHVSCIFSMAYPEAATQEMVHFAGKDDLFSSQENIAEG